MHRTTLLPTILTALLLGMTGMFGCSLNTANGESTDNEPMENTSGSSFVEQWDVDPAEPTVELTDEEWRNRLTDDEYHVLRDHGTERAFSGELYGIEKEGTYSCAGCGHELFSSDTRFDSGTGWPSFWAPIDDDAVGTRYDHKLPQTRIEVHCGRCAGHLGHVFPDGPDEETGHRYCMNSVAMDFREAD